MMNKRKRIMKEKRKRFKWLKTMWIMIKHRNQMSISKYS